MAMGSLTTYHLSMKISTGKKIVPMISVGYPWRNKTQPLNNTLAKSNFEKPSPFTIG
jgi:hypothetical protein